MHHVPNLFTGTWATPVRHDFDYDAQRLEEKEKEREEREETERLNELLKHKLDKANKRHQANISLKKQAAIAANETKQAKSMLAFAKSKLALDNMAARSGTVSDVRTRARSEVKKIASSHKKSKKKKKTKVVFEPIDRPWVGGGLSHATFDATHVGTYLYAKTKYKAPEDLSESKAALAKARKKYSKGFFDLKPLGGLGPDLSCARKLKEAARLGRRSLAGERFNQQNARLFSSSHYSFSQHTGSSLDHQEHTGTSSPIRTSVDNAHSTISSNSMEDES